MKPDLSLYVEDIYRVIEDSTVEEAKTRIRQIFNDLEAEVAFLDERRKDAEDNLKIFIEALALQKKEQEENANS